MIDDINGAVVPVDLATGSLGEPISVPYDDDDGDGAYGIAITSGGTAWVSGAASATLIPINLGTRAVGKPIHVVTAPNGVFGIAVTPDGKTAYVTNNSSDIIPINLATRAVGKPITVRPDAGDVAIAP